MSKNKASLPFSILACSLATWTIAISTQAADLAVRRYPPSPLPTPVVSVSPQASPSSLPGGTSGVNPGPGPGNPASNTGP
jgi:hypothetical protein